jgi:DNA-binding LacI/PurR family transcriptional regulator
MRSLCAQRPLAIIAFTFGMPEDVVAELRRYQDQGGIVVCYSHDVEVPFDNVDFGLCDAIYKATHHLLELGHRKLAFCYHGIAPEGVPPHPSFARALNDFGLAPNQAWILHDYLYEEAGMRYAAQILAMRDRPTALHVTNDVAASTFVNEIQRGGVMVPRDMSVVGLNDAPAARTAAVRLTTVSHPVDELVGHIVRLLEERIENPALGAGRRVVVNGELIVRESSGPAPHVNEF